MPEFVKLEKKKDLLGALLMFPIYLNKLIETVCGIFGKSITEMAQSVLQWSCC